MKLFESLHQLDATSPTYAVDFVERLLQDAIDLHASDVHCQPVAGGLEVRIRIDGVLHLIGVFSRGELTDVVTRLKVMGELLTYQSEVPQEGRVRHQGLGVEIRLSTFPTLHGERAAIRILAAAQQLVFLDDLGLRADLLQVLRGAIRQSSGAFLVAGPAGSGKTTTVYAMLREIARAGESFKNIVTLEDPIEAAIDNVAQSQIRPNFGFTLASGVRSLLRQDPEVIFVGEIRDQETAVAVFQASLTGHLVFSTFHAGNVSEAIGRLFEMGIEPHLLRSGLQAILAQRLMRRLCECRVPSQVASQMLGLLWDAEGAFNPGKCQKCHETGYQGRLLVTEWVARLDGTLTTETIDHPARHGQSSKSANGPLREAAIHLVQSGMTSPQEFIRVFGASC